MRFPIIPILAILGSGLAACDGLRSDNRADEAYEIETDKGEPGTGDTTGVGAYPGAGAGPAADPGAAAAGAMAQPDPRVDGGGDKAVGTVSETQAN